MTYPATKSVLSSIGGVLQIYLTTAAHIADNQVAENTFFKRNNCCSEVKYFLPSQSLCALIAPSSCVQMVVPRSKVKRWLWEAWSMVFHALNVLKWALVTTSDCKLTKGKN